MRRRRVLVDWMRGLGAGGMLRLRLTGWVVARLLSKKSELELDLVIKLATKLVGLGGGGSGDGRGEGVGHGGVESGLKGGWVRGGWGEKGELRVGGVWLGGEGHGDGVRGWVVEVGLRGLGRLCRNRLRGMVDLGGGG